MKQWPPLEWSATEDTLWCPRQLANSQPEHPPFIQSPSPRPCWPAEQHPSHSSAHHSPANFRPSPSAAWPLGQAVAEFLTKSVEIPPKLPAPLFHPKPRPSQPFPCAPPHPS